MKILFAGQVGESLPPLYAGVPKRALLLAKEWKRDGSEIGICFSYRHDREDDLGAGASYFFEYPKKPRTADKALFILKRCIEHPILLMQLIKEGSLAFGSLSKDVLIYSAYGVFLDSVVASFKPEIIIGESGMHRSFFAAVIAKRHQIPYVLETYAEVHDTSVLRFKDESARSAYWKYFFSMCSRIIAPSDYCAKGPLTYASAELVHMVYATTLDVSAFESDARTQAEGRDRFEIPRTRFIVAAVGSFSPRKGHDHLIKAVAMLRRKGYDAGVLLCGEGNPEWLHMLAKQEGMEESTYVQQNLSEKDLRLLFRTADMYCDASNTPRACLGIALTEALATGIPAIAYDVAGLPEVVKDGETGYLVPLDDIEKLADTIEKIILSTDEERSVLGQNGRKRARNVFDLHGIAKLLLDELHSTYDGYTKANSRGKGEA